MTEHRTRRLHAQLLSIGRVGIQPIWTCRIWWCMAATDKHTYRPIPQLTAAPESCLKAKSTVSAELAQATSNGCNGVRNHALCLPPCLVADDHVMTRGE
jgi:hypothetical protein